MKPIVEDVAHGEDLLVVNGHVGVRRAACKIQLPKTSVISIPLTAAFGNPPITCDRGLKPVLLVALLNSAKSAAKRRGGRDSVPVCRILMPVGSHGNSLVQGSSYEESAGIANPKFFV